MEHKTEHDKENPNLWHDEESREAMDTLIRQYQKSVFSFVLYLSGSDWDEAYDITVNCFVEAFSGAESSSKEALLVRLFTCAMDRSLKAKAMPLFDPIKFINATSPRKNILRTAKEALKSLPSDEKAMLLLRDQANLSYEKIALIMKIPSEDIKAKTWQVKNNFRDKVEKILDRDRGRQ